MADPGSNPERQPSPSAQPTPNHPTSVNEAPNPTESEPLPPVHEEEVSLHLQPEPQPQQPPVFQPLFTLVTDGTTRATHHPRVHYIFSDDDPDILTEALARHGSQQQFALTSFPSGSGTFPDDRERHRPQSTGSTTGPPLNERVIVLDLVPRTSTKPSVEHSATAAATTSGGCGYEVAWASSLSSDWAVVSAKISPMADDINASATAVANSTDPNEDNPPQQLILRIEGLGGDAVPSSSAPPQATPGTRARTSSAATATGIGAGAGSSGRGPSVEERDLRLSGSSATGQGQGQHGQEKGKEDYAAILEEFDKRMGLLRKVVDAGMDRQRKLTVDEDDLGQEVLPSGTHAHDWGALTGGEQGQRESAKQQREGQATVSSTSNIREAI
ncbi:hypothetical protein SLS53_006079 [Cytospora paraplurivora]|uniref:Uncharacterized protein n=1 Tax=Cytospora paraplurivora TaxID=2898453 RepID=A0AAN9U6P4_9PEZI